MWRRHPKATGHGRRLAKRWLMFNKAGSWLFRSTSEAADRNCSGRATVTSTRTIMKAVMCLRPICRREENITNRARTGPNEESKSASNIGGSYSKKRIASKQGTSLTSPAYIRPRENAHGVPIRHWRIGASREGFRPCKLLPKQLATGELLTSL